MKSTVIFKQIEAAANQSYGPELFGLDQLGRVWCLRHAFHDAPEWFLTEFAEDEFGWQPAAKSENKQNDDTEGEALGES